MSPEEMSADMRALRKRVAKKVAASVLLSCVTAIALIVLFPDANSSSQTYVGWLCLFLGFGLSLNLAWANMGAWQEANRFLRKWDA